MYCNSLLSYAGPKVDIIFEKLQLIDQYYDKYNANTWWREFSKILDTCYDKTKKDADKVTAATKIIGDWDPFIFYGWTDSILGTGKGKAIEKEVALVEEFESENLRKKYERRLIEAFEKRDTVPQGGNG